MNAHDPKHLTADELDAFLTDSSSHLVASHLATCPACASMVEQDRRLIAMLAVLPISTPRSGFGDRVMRGLAPRQALGRRAGPGSTPGRCSCSPQGDRCAPCRRRQHGGGVRLGIGASSRRTPVVGAGPSGHRARPLVVAADGRGKRNRAALVCIAARHHGHAGSSALPGERGGWCLRDSPHGAPAPDDRAGDRCGVVTGRLRSSSSQS